MTNSSNNKFHSVLKKQQQSLSFTLPLGMHRILVPLQRVHLGWQLKKGFFRHRLWHKIGDNYLTMENSVVLVCQVVQKSSLFRSSHKKLLKNIALPRIPTITGPLWRFIYLDAAARTSRRNSEPGRRR